MAILPAIAVVGIYVSALTGVYAREQVCNVIEGKSTYYQLKKYLFCDYDPNVRPATDPKRKTDVDVLFVLQFVEYDSWSSSLDFHGWLRFAWTDPHLTWTPDDYGGRDGIELKNGEVWIPGIRALNTRHESVTGLSDLKCSLWEDGTVYCESPVRFSVICDSHYTFWPYDRHNCTLQVGTWLHEDNDVELLVANSFVVMDSFKSNPRWKIACTDVHNETLQKISATFSIKRTSPEVRDIVVSPVIILTVITLATLWLKPGSSERRILSYTNLLGHLLVLQCVNWHLPETGSNPPNILLFYNNSLILSTLALILICWLQRLTDCKREVPLWLSTTLFVILASKPGQILLLSALDPKTPARLQEDADDNSSFMNSEPRKSNWEFVVTFIGWILFLSFSVVYFIMFGIFFQYPASDDDLYQYF